MIERETGDKHKYHVIMLERKTNYTGRFQLALTKTQNTSETLWNTP